MFLKTKSNRKPVQTKNKYESACIWWNCNIDPFKKIYRSHRLFTFDQDKYAIPRAKKQLWFKRIKKLERSKILNSLSHNEINKVTRNLFYSRITVTNKNVFFPKLSNNELQSTSIINGKTRERQKQIYVVKMEIINTRRIWRRQVMHRIPRVSEAENFKVTHRFGILKRGLASI